MNFVNSERLNQIPRFMKNGDLIVAYERHDSMDHFYLEAGKILNNKFGAFHHNDFIGKSFGSRIRSRSTAGWLYALEPTPELWSLAVHTRTQIVNELDASYVILNLDLYPGCTVVESGTGSGCMTLAIARVIAPTGQVFTYEYNPVRAEAAKSEFESLGVSHLVTVTCRDVCGKFDSSGGGFIGVAPNSADAVFLDLPEPWLAIDHALAVLKPNKTMCSYSPCIEQVMKTTEQLRKSGFHSIRMVEVRQRPFDARSVAFENVDLGRPERIENEKGTEKSGEGNGAGPAPPAEVGRDDCRQEGQADGENDEQESLLKRPRLQGTQSYGGGDEMNGTLDLDLDRAVVNGISDVATVHGKAAERMTEDKKPRDLYPHRTRNHYKPAPPPARELMVARPLASMKGHTAFLTFAVSPPTPFVKQSSRSNTAAGSGIGGSSAAAAVIDAFAGDKCVDAIEGASSGSSAHISSDEQTAAETSRSSDCSKQSTL